MAGVRQGMTTRILTIDGGGVLGSIPAQLLSMVDLSGVDVVGGTSVGAGVCALVASRKTGSLLTEGFSELAHGVFRNRFFRRVNPFLTSYAGEDLEETLDSLFNFPISDLPIPFYATSLRLTEDPHPKVFDRTDDWTLSQVCRASMSAPTYFPPYKRDGVKWVDGGLWCNNPSVVTCWAVHREGIPYSDIRLFSMGTGRPFPRKVQGASSWSKFGWGLYLIPYLTQGNVIGSTFGSFQLGLQYCERFEGPLRDPSWGLDSVDKIGEMQRAAAMMEEDFKRRWEEFMEDN